MEDERIAFTEHEQEFIDCLIDELATWGYSIRDLDESALRTMLRDTASHPWGEREKVFLSWLDLYGRNGDGKLEPLEVKECLKNAGIFSEFPISRWGSSDETQDD